MNEKKGTQRAALEQKLIDKAKADPAFRALLKQDPKAAFKQLLGIDLPASITVDVLEETPAKLYLVLPVDLSAVELPEDMLARVSGGACTCGGC